MPTLGISDTTKEKGVGWEERTDRILQIRHKVRVTSWTTSFVSHFHGATDCRRHKYLHDTAIDHSQKSRVNICAPAPATPSPKAELDASWALVHDTVGSQGRIVGSDCRST